MLKKLKGLFVVEDESDVGKKKEVQDADVKDVQSSKQSKATADVKMTNPNAAPNKKFLDVLLKAIEANNLDGFDYLEYKQSLQSLSKMDMDELTKYKSALVMAESMGVNKASLLKSGNHYLKVLKKEETKFLQAHKNQMSKQVSDRENRLKQLSNLIKEKEGKIKKLQAEIATHNKEFEAEKAAINKSAAKVSATKDGFLAAYQQVKGQIEKDLQKMNEYL